MATSSSRVARFVMEVAPPQFVCVMRQRTSTMLDTIAEEDHRDSTVFNETLAFSSSKLSSSFSSSSSATATAKAKAKAKAPSASTSSPNYFEINSSLSIYGY
ncbi:hypothetical protein BVC80_8345g1 [Macleaya cordata]|uniref:Uncharacterized protein n=1 Tax=Macleaya cordata TaxID=56857 RepID=A0A200R919_MACCD|nr:hypothetical protein BVC80_8345g1 [Macleaya cordata]